MTKKRVCTAVPKQKLRKGDKSRTRQVVVVVVVVCCGENLLVDATSPIHAAESVRRQLELDPPVQYTVDNAIETYFTCRPDCCCVIYVNLS